MGLLSDSAWGCLHQEYQGYSIWRPDPRMPDFLNCSADWWGQIFKPAGAAISYHSLHAACHASA
jgi:hypothetical protein